MAAMPKIQVLPPEIANRIAAGEVVERPSSVVKELVENSLDAGANRVEVEIEEGGKNLVRITDDGVGIGIDDLPLTFASHATSKLRLPDDLFSIGTLGFRGEALASIGSVAQAKITSLARGEASGAEIECRGGTIDEARPCAASAGTVIEIRNLFYNVPVRRKFLKSTASETANITDTLTKMALAYPGVHFRLTSNQKEVFDCPPSTRLERTLQFYGRDLSDALLEIKSESPELTIEGYAALPTTSRANRSWQFLFLNGRCIQDKSLNHAMNEAYRGLMPDRRFPIIFLFLEMDPSEVDVNVHPTKIEVRFRSEWSLYGRVLNAIRQRLLSDETTGTLKVDPQQNLFGPASQSSPAADRAAPVAATPDPVLRPPKPVAAPSREKPTPRPLASGTGPPATRSEAPKVGPAATPSPTARPRPQARADTAPTQEEQATGGPGLVDEAPSPASTSAKELASTPPGELAIGAGLEFETPRFLQIHEAYIVQETPAGFIVIDQHALHERILFFEVREKVERGAVESQHLLLPEPVELTPKEMALIRELTPALKALGFAIEEFGKHSIVVQAVPAFLKSASARQVLHDVLSELGEGQAPRSLEAIRERILSTIACKAAIKAGDPLTDSEIASLLKRGAEIPETIACAHGRPTRLAVNLNDLERQFGRK